MCFLCGVGEPEDLAEELVVCLSLKSQRLKRGSEITGRWWCELIPDQASTFHTGDRIVRGGGFVWELRKGVRARILSLKATLPQPRPQLVRSRPQAQDGVCGGRSAGEITVTAGEEESGAQGGSPPEAASRGQ